jgi:hypothetical protein
MPASARVTLGNGTFSEQLSGLPSAICPIFFTSIRDDAIPLVGEDEVAGGLLVGEGLLAVLARLISVRAALAWPLATDRATATAVRRRRNNIASEQHRSAGEADAAAVG